MLCSNALHCAPSHDTEQHQCRWHILPRQGFTLSVPESASTMQTHWKSRTREFRSLSLLSHVCIHNTISLPHVLTCRSQGQSLPQSEPPVSSLGGIQTRPARWRWSAGSSQALWCWVTAVSSSRSCTMAQRWLRPTLRLQLAAARARIGR